MSISHTQTRNILLLSANPKGTSQLRLAEEMRDIREGLRLSENRDLLMLVYRLIYLNLINSR
ncbi:MAG: hypothetical protein KME54_13925 [Tolypothrix brevis GSE-NOS-MK-07-07A]|nr:hypothetical protein [Tolypothrix brevis GSE-NOS-MK-07-07A]